MTDGSTKPLRPSRRRKRSSAPSPASEEGGFTPERVSLWAKGEMSLAELSDVSASEMEEMASSGYGFYEHGQYEDAQVIFEALCALAPEEAYYRTALGAVFLAQERLDEAERALDEALDLDSKEIASYVNRGEVYLRCGRLEEAARDFERAMALDPEEQDALTERARVLAAAALATLEAQGSVAAGGARDALTGGRRK